MRFKFSTLRMLPRAVGLGKSVFLPSNGFGLHSSGERFTETIKMLHYQRKLMSFDGVLCPEQLNTNIHGGQ